MLELNKIYCGDCKIVMKQIDDNSIDMILCDLPYGTTACKWDTIIPFEPLWTQYKRIIKDNGAVVLTASQPFTSALVMSNIKMFKYEWIWVKNRKANFFQANFQPLKYHENILVFSKSVASFTRSKNKPAMKYNPIKAEKIKIRKSAITNHPRVMEGRNRDGYVVKSIESNYDFPKSIFFISNNEETGLHPTQKPIALFEYLIKTYTNKGDLVLDNCIGSGTTAVACKQLDRNFIGIEINPDYVDIANKRLANTYYQEELLK